LLHREILPDAVEIDHKNHNGLDNQRENLRPANASLNMANRRKLRKANFSSPFKGVCYAPSAWPTKPWLAGCAHKYIGRFTTEIEAALAYDQAARELFGPFAKTNFADEK
jgi:hypothetical protein